LAFCGAQIIVKGLLTFPTDWDSLMYHIPLVDQWLATHSLYAPNDGMWYNAGNHELLGLWLAAPFSGDFLIALINLPAVFLLAAAAIELGTTFGLSRPLAHLVGFAVIATTPVLRQLMDSENDVAVVGLFLASLLYTIRFYLTCRCEYLVATGVTIGILSGVKYYALGYVMIAVVVLVFLTWSMRDHRLRIIAPLVIGTGLLIFGCPWYIRNLWMAGSPIYPVGFSADNDLWSEMRPESWSSSFVSNVRPVVLNLVLKCVEQMAGPCHLVAIVAVPITLFWLSISAWRLRSTTARLRCSLVFLIVATFLVLFVSPNTVEMVPGTMDMLRGQYLPARFGLCFMSVTIIGTALVLQDASQLAAALLVNWRPPTIDGLSDHQRLRPSVSSVLLICGYTTLAGLLIYYFTQLVWRERSWTGNQLDKLPTACNFFASGVLLRLCWNTWPPWRRAMRYALVGLSVIVVGSAVPWLASRWHDNFFSFYDIRYHSKAMSVVSQLDPSLNRICVCEFRYYPFFGSRRQFHVARPLWVPTYPRLATYLRNHQTTIVITKYYDSSKQQRYENVPEWLTTNPQAFQILYSDDVWIVARVNQAHLPREQNEETVHTRLP